MEVKSEDGGAPLDLRMLRRPSVIGNRSLNAAYVDFLVACREQFIHYYSKAPASPNFQQMSQKERNSVLAFNVSMVSGYEVLDSYKGQRVFWSVFRHYNRDLSNTDVTN